MTEQDILDKIAEHVNMINDLNELLDELKRPPKTFDELVFKKYIEYESLPKTVKFVNENGYRKPKGTKYTSNDLSEVVQNKKADIPAILIKFAQLIFKRNTKAVARLYW